MIIEGLDAVKLEITGGAEPTVTERGRAGGVGKVVLPAGPSHRMVKVGVLVNRIVLKEPLVGSMPDVAPKAVPVVNSHELLLVDVQLMVLVAPYATEEGDAVSVIAGAAVTTENALVWLTVSPAVTPVHVIVNDAELAKVSV